MPSPIVHIATGLAIHLATEENGPSAWRRLFLISASAMLPDADVIAGLFFRRLGAFHNNGSHSILVTVAGSSLLSVAAREEPNPLFVAALSHLFLDWLGSKRGLKLFWPLSHRRFSAGIPLFRGLRWNAPIGSSEHRKTIINELPYAFVVLILSIAARRFLERKESASNLLIQRR